MSFRTKPSENFPAPYSNTVRIPPISLLRHLRVERGKVVDARNEFGQGRLAPIHANHGANRGRRRHMLLLA